MLTVPTALLLHATRSGSHYDWLIGSPGYVCDPASGLWTARVGLPSRSWRRAEKFDLMELPAHRRVYLSYQGPISGNRGSVIRVDQGSVVIRLWRDSLMLLDVHMQSFDGQIELMQKTDISWCARVVF